MPANYPGVNIHIGWLSAQNEIKYEHVLLFPLHTLLLVEVLHTLQCCTRSKPEVAHTIKLQQKSLTENKYFCIFLKTDQFCKVTVVS